VLVDLGFQLVEPERRQRLDRGIHPVDLAVAISVY
jgi:hypothetical protein